MGMVGDYYRYIAENAKGDNLKGQAASPRRLQRSQRHCPPSLQPHQARTRLNFSVFHYEAMKNHKAACDLADQSLQDALDKIDELEEDDFRDAKSIIELLKENLTLWREEEDNDNAIDDL